MYCKVLLRSKLLSASHIAIYCTISAVKNFFPITWLRYTKTNQLLSRHSSSSCSNISLIRGGIAPFGISSFTDTTRSAPAVVETIKKQTQRFHQQNRRVGQSQVTLRCDRHIVLSKLKGRRYSKKTKISLSYDVNDHVYTKSKPSNFARIKTILNIDGFLYGIRLIYADLVWTFD